VGIAEHLNGDLSVRAAADTASMEWMPSPSGTVWRKRVHLVGAPESGQVTSIVRYEPESSFPAHDHPGGEEILVLDGVFSDEHGDWPAGTYLLNPEGFRHAPYSKDGCLLFVKLRQFPGRDRQHVAIDTTGLEWHAQPGYSDTMRLERWQPRADPGTVSYEHGAELLVLEGSFSDEEGEYETGSWLRLPEGGRHHPRSANGCTLYVKQSGLPYLRSAG
jgi:anti-sigma factor ChrR (cupin superfamily)